MKRSNRHVPKPFWRSPGRWLVLAVSAPAIAGCSPGATKGAAEQSVAVAAATPFARLADPSGCLIEQLTAGDDDEYQVQGASGDGRWLAMTARRAGATQGDTLHQVSELDLTTGTKTDLSPALTNSGPYSPDGRYIVLAQAMGADKTDIVEYERATGALRPVASHEDWDWLPSYSPDGRSIVFNSYRVNGQSDVHLFDKTTGALRRLTDEPGYDAHAQFSGDGRRIVYHRQRGKRDGGGHLFDLMVYDLGTGKSTRLTHGDYEESYPAWAPDGRHIVFSSDAAGKPGKLNLYVLGPGGRSTTRLTQGDWKDSYAFWSRDGRFIYFNSDRAGATNIYRIVMDGVDCVRNAR